MTSVLSDEDGVGLVEYGVLISLIAGVCFLAVQSLGAHVKSLYEQLIF